MGKLNIEFYRIPYKILIHTRADLILPLQAKKIFVVVY